MIIDQQKNQSIDFHLNGAIDFKQSYNPANGDESNPSFVKEKLLIKLQLT